MNLIRLNIKSLTIIFLFLSNLLAHGQGNIKANSIDTILKIADRNSATIKSGYQQSLSAKWTKIAAIGNTVNIKSPFNASWIDNTELPVNFLPAQVFGGPAGTFKEVSLGQEYVTTYGITPQIDIINPSVWARIKSAEINKQLTETNNLIAKKNLYESIAASYYNIVSLQNQIVYLEKNMVAADSIFLIAKNKFQEGIIREQDLNNAKINQLNINDRLTQARFSLEQNYNSLKILCDLKEETTIEITETLQNLEYKETKVEKNTLFERLSQLQAAYYKSELNATRLNSFSPTISVVFNQNWQRNSNTSFNDALASKFSSQYVGLKVSVPFPFDANRLSANYTSKISYNISKINSNHIELQNQINYKQLELEFQKASSTFLTTKTISELKSINYNKSYNQYNEGLISTEILLTSFSDKILSELNYSSAYANLKFTESKIKINNTLK